MKRQISIKDAMLTKPGDSNTIFFSIATKNLKVKKFHSQAAKLLNQDGRTVSSRGVKHGNVECFQGIFKGIPRGLMTSPVRS